MSPVIRALGKASWADCQVLVTGQHRELLNQMLVFFDIVSCADLEIMEEDQTLPALTAKLLVQLDKQLIETEPDVVIVQGDTTTVYCMAMACFYQRIPFGHVEAGLRTGHLYSPFPEEANRVMVDRLASLHFAPTELAKGNLIREGIDVGSIFVTGNTVIDALRETADRHIPIGVDIRPKSRLILITAHRRENFNGGIANICEAINILSKKYPKIEFLWPVHPNPSVKGLVTSHIVQRGNITLCEPLSYGSFVSAMQRSYLILTDSGGLQEEAPSLAKPVLVMRDTTERPEAIRAGVSRLVGTRAEDIIAGVSELLENDELYGRMSCGGELFGDGRASQRIVEAIREYLNVPVGCS